MIDLRILLCIAATLLARSVLTYEITQYYEEVATLDRFKTLPVSVTRTGSAAPTPIEETTTTTDRVTVVSALISSGFGTVLDTPQDTQYYVYITYSECFGTGATGPVITKLASLTLPPEVTGYLTPLSVTTFGSSTRAVMAAASIDPIDFAGASYWAQPAGEPECTRAKSTVDYRQVCSPRTDRTSSSATRTEPAQPSKTSISCGELNPCCYGCHGWGHGVVFADQKEYYICEDGRYLFLNGSEKVMPPWSVKNAGSRQGLSVMLIAAGSVALFIPML